MKGFAKLIGRKSKPVYESPGELYEPEIRPAGAEPADEADLQLEEEPGREESLSLTRRQITLLAGAGIASFVLFLFLFFPFDGILRYVLKNRLPQGTRIEFADLRASLLGSTRIQGLLISREPGLRLDAENAVSDLKVFSLLRFSPRGTIRLNDGAFSFGPMAGSFKSLEVILDLGDVLHSPFPEWQGTVQVRLTGFEPDQIPQFPVLQKLPLTVSDLAVSRMQLKVTFTKGSFQINQGSLDSALFRLQMEGTGRSAADPTASSLDGKLCIRPVDDLESRNPSISGLYNSFVATGSQAGGESCFRVTGSVGAPSFAAVESQPASTSN